MLCSAGVSSSVQVSKYEARQISLFYVVDAFFDLVMHHVEKIELLSLSLQPPLTISGTKR